MNNTMKVVVGSVLGTSISAAISTILERRATKETVEGVVEAAGEQKESLRDRWERAKRAGEAARADKQAELKAYFRAKVNDPDAFLHHPELGAEPTPARTGPVIVEPGTE